MEQPAASPPIPRRTLRPGLHVVRRDDRHLQVGLDAPHRLVVEDHPEVRRVLGELRAGRPSTAATRIGHRLLARLADADLLVDADLLDDALARAAARGLDRATVRACFARHGNGAAARLEARTAARVVLDVPGDLEPAAARQLRADGVEATSVRVDGSPAPTAVLVASRGEPTRERLDPLVRAGLPHLLLTGGPLGATLGPFVVPGVTACLRCLDAHRGESDPRRATVLEQCARLDAAARPAACPLAGALAWAVAELVWFVDGERPATWSATATWEAGPVPLLRSWSRHPHCGCAWDVLPATG